MDLLLSTSALGLITIAYGAATGLTLFGSQYKIEDPNKLFITEDRRDRYQDYNASNFTVAVTILVACILLFILVKIRADIHKSVFYVFSLFFLIFTAIYYVVVGILIFELARLNDNKISTQAIINFSYAFILLIFAILIILFGKGYQKSSSSGSTNSSPVLVSS